MPELIQIPALTDNYAWLLVQDHQAIVVDPPEARPVLEELARRPQLTLTAILNTHHHGDHTGGNQELVAATGCAVWGPAHDAERIPAITRRVTSNESVDVAGIRFRIIDVRAHTRGHIAWVTDTVCDAMTLRGHDREPTSAPDLAGRPLAFTGDALFLGGCGRLFEGTVQELVRALTSLSQLNPRTLVVCAHEYTLRNLSFAADVLPDHRAIQARLQRLRQRLQHMGSTVPGILAEELETNPFLLALREPFTSTLARQLHVPEGDVESVVGALRQARNGY